MLEKNTIPKIIHYVWVGGKEKPKDVMENVESWKKACPDYQIKEWNESNFDINSVPYVKQAYESKKYAFVSDYIRLYALYTEGGIYLDTDVELYNDFAPFLDCDFFSTYENMVILTLAICGASKNSQVVKDLLSMYENRSFYLDKKKRKLDLTPNVILNSVLLKYKYKVNLDNSYQTLFSKYGVITTIPNDYYFPQDYITKKTIKTENTRGIHKYAFSWATKKQLREDAFVEWVLKVLGEKNFRKIEKLFLDIRIKRYTRKYKKLLKKIKDK